MLKIWKSGRIYRYIIDHRQYKSSCRSLQWQGKTRQSKLCGFCIYLPRILHLWTFVVNFVVTRMKDCRKLREIKLKTLPWWSLMREMEAQKALMMLLWCADDALLMHWWCMSVIFDILEPWAFQKYSTCWVFWEFCLCLRLGLCLCVCLCLEVDTDSGCHGQGHLSL